MREDLGQLPGEVLHAGAFGGVVAGENEANIAGFRFQGTMESSLAGEQDICAYAVGVGKKYYPIYIGEREAAEVIWNPAWIPPSSDWVAAA